MNKSTIGNYLIVLAIGVLVGFLFCFYSGNKKNGASELQETKLLAKIDSLNSQLDSSKARVEEIYITKTKLKTQYETDTIYINQLPVDSLLLLFSKYYPESKQDSISE